MPISGSRSGCCSGFPPSHSRHNLRLTLRPHNLGVAGFADLRLAAVSPFVDSRQGSRRVARASCPHLITAKFTLFARRAEDLDVAPPNSEHSADSGAILWHKTP